MRKANLCVGNALVPCAAFAGVVMLIATPARAHEGPRIWIDNDNGQIATYTSDNDLDPTVYSPSRFFSTDLAPYFGIFTNEFPGYEVKQFDLHVNSGTTFGYRIAGPLLYYQASGNHFVTVRDAFPPPQHANPPQVAVVLSSDDTRSGDLPVSGFNFFTFNSVGDHSHLSYLFLGDGLTASDGPSGSYLLPLQLTSTSLATSKVFYLMLNKEASESEISDGTAIGQAVSTAKPGDANYDGHVNLADLSILVANNGRIGNVWWGTADFTADGKVNTLDFNLLAGNYDTPATFAADLLRAQSSVPEPISLPMLLVCGYFLRRSCRR